MATRQSSYNYEELLSCGRGELFGPGNAQLPLPPMLMVHRITEISETGGAHDKGFIRAEYDVSADDWYFPCHFQGNPIMPGCLGLDGMCHAGHLVQDPRRQLLHLVSLLDISALHR